MTSLDFPTVAYQWLARAGERDRGRGRREPRWHRRAGRGASRGRWTTGRRSSPRATSSSPAAPSRTSAALAEAVHRKGALLLVDGYQAAGQLPVDVRALDVDFYCSGGLKWLLGGTGVAFMYARPELWPTLRPRASGWFAHREQFRFDPRDAGAPRRRAPARGRHAGAHAGLRPARRARGDRGARRRGDPPPHHGAGRGPDRAGPRAPGSGRRSRPTPEERTAIVMLPSDDPPAAVRRLAEAGSSPTPARATSGSRPTSTTSRTTTGPPIERLTS